MATAKRIVPGIAPVLRRRTRASPPSMAVRTANVGYAPDRGSHKARPGLIVLFFIAGFFASALPWAPVAAMVTNAIGLWRRRSDDQFVLRWWEVSRGHAVAIVTGRLLAWIALDTLAMLAGNWLQGVL